MFRFRRLSRHRDDVLARVVRDEESSDGAKQLRRFGNVAELEMRDLSGERNVARAIEETTVVAVGTPREQTRREISGRGIGAVELNEFLEHPMRRIFVRLEVGEGEVADFPARGRLLQKPEHFLFADLGEKRISGLRRCPEPVAEVDEHIEAGRAGSRSPHPRERARVAGDFEQSLLVSPAPFLEYVVVEQHEIFRDLRFAGELPVLVVADSNDRSDERRSGREMLGGQRQSVRVEIVDRQVAVRLEDDRTRVRFDGARVIAHTRVLPR